MHPNSWTFIAKRCPHFTARILLLPLATLGILGFLINTHLSFISQNIGGMCYPKTNIVFLKTHKCAGSSIQNILLRYGDSHNLTFVIPRTGNYLGHPAPFSRTLVGPPWHLYYNILAHHTRLDYPEIKALMPRNSVYITIVRDPVQIFESSYSYYGLDKFFGYDLHKFIEKVPQMDKKFYSKRFRGKFGIDQMLFDLGGDPSIFDNQTKVLDYLDKLESWFHLVLVADRMDESLVLLRHLMCWDIDDVVTFKLNARNPKFKSSLSDREKAVIRKLNYADVLLYDRFLEKFNKEVKNFGQQRMSEEVALLRERTQKWYDLCVKGEQPVTTPRVTPKFYYNPRVMVFEPNKNTTNGTCISMTMEELPYTDNIRKKQILRLPSAFKALFLREKKSKHSQTIMLRRKKS